MTKQTQMDELLPCPFCGGTKLKPYTNAIVCETCETSGPETYVGNIPSAFKHIMEEGYAGHAWNTRQAAPKEDDECVHHLYDHTSPPIATEREAFERVYHDHPLGRVGYTYANHDVAMLWDGWQSARATQHKAVTLDEAVKVFMNGFLNSHEQHPSQAVLSFTAVSDAIKALAAAGIITLSDYREIVDHQEGSNRTEWVKKS